MASTSAPAASKRRHLEPDVVTLSDSDTEEGSQSEGQPATRRQRRFSECDERPLITDWMSVSELERHLVPGDLVEFRRDFGASHGSSPSSPSSAAAGVRDSFGASGAPLYSHWAIYVGCRGRFGGQHTVVHRSNEEGDFNSSTSSIWSSAKWTGTKFVAEVRRDALRDVAQLSLCRRNNGFDRTERPYPATIVIERALSKLGDPAYSLLFNNCEHFAKWARNERLQSTQATVARAVVVGIGSTAVGIGSAALLPGAGLLAGAAFGLLAYTCDEARHVLAANSPGLFGFLVR